MQHLPNWVLPPSLPSKYDAESATVIEQTAKVYGAMNELITETGEFYETTTEEARAFYKATTEDIAAQNKNIADQNAEITRIREVVMPGQVEQTVRAHIRSGEFDQEINEYVGGLEARVDTLLGSVVEGSTTMDAEVIDARVGRSGASYPNLGESIRSQTEKAVFDMPKTYWFNRHNHKAVTNGYYVDPSTGRLDDNESYFTSDYIRVHPNETIYFYNFGLNRYIVRFVAAYDEAKNFISGAGQVGEFEIPENAAFIRFSDAQITPGNVMVAPFYFENKFLMYGEYLPHRVFTEETAHHYLGFTNRYNKNAARQGAYPSYLTGETLQGSAYAATEPIPILPGETLKMFTNYMSELSIRMLACYDKFGNFIEGAQNATSVTQTGDIAYVRFAVPIEFVDSVMIADANTPKYIEYGDIILKDDTNNADQLRSLIGGTYEKATAASVAAGATITLENFPAHIKKNVCIAARAVFSSFSKIHIGRGGAGVYNAKWIEIDSTKIVEKGYAGSENTIRTITHGLTISGSIFVSLSQNDEGAWSCTIMTDSGSFTTGISWGCDACGSVFLYSAGALTNASLSAGCKDLSSQLWLVGDSYFSMADTRVYGQLSKLGYNNYLIIGQPGLGSAGGYYDVAKALNFGTPKTIVWYMGMNDGATAETYSTYLNLLKQMCEARGITLILNKVPSVPTIAKEAIASVINDSGLRYIDSYAAVGSSETGAWKDGLLSSDGVHPTVQGAKILAAQMIVDVPEIIAYGAQ